MVEEKALKTAMSFAPVDPTVAREQFKKRALQSYYVLGGTFLLLAILLSWLVSQRFESFIALIIGNVVAALVAYSAFLFWNRQPLQIRCPGCRKTVSCRTPWVCGECAHENWDVNQTTILDECGKCHLSAKAYLCHHCGKPIFFSADFDRTNPAQRINAEGRRPQLRAEKQRQSQEGFEDKKAGLEQDLEAAKLTLAKEQVNAQIEVVKKGLTITAGQMQTNLDIQLESLKKFMDATTATAEAARREKLQIAEQFKDNPAERRKREILVDEWVRRQLAKVT